MLSNLGNMSSPESNMATSLQYELRPLYNVFISTIRYTNNVEYRNVLKALCYLRFPDGQEYPEEVPHEYRNEMCYDIDNMTLALDYVYKKTKTHPLFQKIYGLGAGEMLTEDDTVGLAIMFSYDYLKYFHPCFTLFLNSPEDFHENCEVYKRLIALFEK